MKKKRTSGPMGFDDEIENATTNLADMFEELEEEADEDATLEDEVIIDHSIDEATRGKYLEEKEAIMEDIYNELNKDFKQEKVKVEEGEEIMKLKDLLLEDGFLRYEKMFPMEDVAKFVADEIKVPVMIEPMTSGEFWKSFIDTEEIPHMVKSQMILEYYPSVPVAGNNNADGLVTHQLTISHGTSEAKADSSNDPLFWNKSITTLSKVDQLFREKNSKFFANGGLTPAVSLPGGVTKFWLSTLSSVIAFLGLDREDLAELNHRGIGLSIINKTSQSGKTMYVVRFMKSSK